MWDLTNLAITQEMLCLIASIDEFKGSWQLYGKMAPEKLNHLKKVATIESIGSSTRIEGSKLSNKDIENLLKKTTVHPQFIL